MSDTLMTIIGIILAVILMFFFPIMEAANKNDEISQTVVQVAVTDFVNTVTSQGKITQFDYNKLVQKLYSTGNSYDIQIEAQILDDNPRRETTTSSKNLTGEYKYYSVYTNTILDQVNGDKGEYILKKDDFVIVTVKNTNITVGTTLKNVFYKLIGKDTYTIGTEATALVLNGGYEEITPVATGNPPEEDPPVVDPPVVDPPVIEPPVEESVVRVTKKGLKLKNADVMFIIDYSNSMFGDNADTRINPLKNSLNLLISKMGATGANNFFIGVMGFGTTAKTIGTASSSTEISPLINSIYAQSTLWDTNYDEAFKETQYMIEQYNLKNSGNKKIIIFLTDGQSNLGNGIEEAVNVAKNNIDHMYLIAYGWEQIPILYDIQAAVQREAGVPVEMDRAIYTDIFNKLEKIFYQVLPGETDDDQFKDGYLPLSEIKVASNKPLQIEIIKKNDNSLVKQYSITQLSSASGIIVDIDGTWNISLEAITQDCGLASQDININVTYYID